MQKKGIRRVPIVVADTLVGILAQGDLNRAQPSALSNSQEEFARVMEETPVSRLMIQNAGDRDRGDLAGSTRPRPSTR